jgi:hypothetical protein
MNEMSSVSSSTFLADASVPLNSTSSHPRRSSFSKVIDSLSNSISQTLSEFFPNESLIDPNFNQFKENYDKLPKVYLTVEKQIDLYKNNIMAQINNITAIVDSVNEVCYDCNEDDTDSAAIQLLSQVKQSASLIYVSQQTLFNQIDSQFKPQLRRSIIQFQDNDALFIKHHKLLIDLDVQRKKVDKLRKAQYFTLEEEIQQLKLLTEEYEKLHNYLLSMMSKAWNKRLDSFTPILSELVALQQSTVKLQQDALRTISSEAPLDLSEDQSRQQLHKQLQRGDTTGQIEEQIKQTVPTISVTEKNLSENANDRAQEAKVNTPLSATKVSVNEEISSADNSAVSSRRSSQV